MARVKVRIRNEQQAVRIPFGMRWLIRRCCLAVLKTEGFAEPAEVAVTFVDNEEIARLNGEFRQKPVPTDVLSFPMGENGVYDENPETGLLLLGDIVISAQKAFEQAGLYGHSVRREIGFLTVHSMLHLLGYDHELGPEETARMRAKEETVLSALGVTREIRYTGEEQ